MGKGHRHKVAVITGGAAGIGQAFAGRLAEDGAHIVIADVAPADETVRLVEQAGRDALACRCDVASPGLTRTPGTLNRKPREGIASMEDEFGAVAAMQAIKRGEVPEDLVGTVSFLTSDDAAFITGQTLNVDGGRVRS